MTDNALHFWRPGSDSASLLVATNYKVAALFLSDYPMHKNVMTNIPSFSRSETVFNNVDTASGRPQRHRPEQKRVGVTGRILRKFTAPGAVVFNPCMDTDSAAE